MASAEALNLVAAFGRAQNFPRDEAGVIALADGLASASKIIGVSMADIVARCAEASPYCPTNADMLGVAREVRGPAIWSGNYGRKCPHCDGTGWRVVYSLHTHEGGGHNYVRKEWITEAVYRAFDHVAGRLRTPRQYAYNAVARCQCGSVQATADHGQRAANDREDG
jgi:hypothetical protein